MIITASHISGGLTKLQIIPQNPFLNVFSSHIGSTLSLTVGFSHLCIYGLCVLSFLLFPPSNSLYSCGKYSGKPLLKKKLPYIFDLERILGFRSGAIFREKIELIVPKNSDRWRQFIFSRRWLPLVAVFGTNFSTTRCLCYCWWVMHDVLRHVLTCFPPPPFFSPTTTRSVMFGHTRLLALGEITQTLLLCRATEHSSIQSFV